MPFVTESISRIGGREINEDFCAFLQIDQNVLWVVADGLGGHRGGEVASKVAVDAALASFQNNPEFSAAALQGHLEAAQQAVLQAQKSQPSLSTMRTTFVVLLTDSTHALWAHIGDSRLYCLENGRIVFCTKDHSVVQAMVNAGEVPANSIRHHEDRNRLLRTVGNGEDNFRPTLLPQPRTLHRGTAFLLCTDGFWENVTETEMEVDYVKADAMRDWLALMEGRLLERLTDESDNYTVIAVKFNSETAPIADDESFATTQWQAPTLQKAHLARIGLLGILLIAVEVLGLQVWNSVCALDGRAEGLTGETDTMAKVVKAQQERLDDLQRRVRDNSNSASLSPIPRLEK